MPILELNGKRIEVDDSFLSMTPDQQNKTVDEIEQSLGGAPAPQPSPAYTDTANEMSAITRGLDQPKAEPTPSTATYLMQRGDRGVADALGAPVDLLTAGLNAGLFGADKVAQLFGGSAPFRFQNPVGGSDFIANMASKANDAAGGHVIGDEEVGPMTRVLGAGARGVGGALVPGMGLASKSAQAVEKVGAPFLKRQVAALAEPYAVNPGATLARDAVAGGGSMAAAQTYDDYTPTSVQDSTAGPYLKLIASLLGGVGGAVGTGVVEGGTKGLANFGRNVVKGKGDPSGFVSPATGQPHTRTDMDQAAYVAQQMPSNRAQATANIDDNTRDFSQFANPSQTPTTGMLADDIGMAMQENILRSKDPQRFAERDAARRSLASSKVDETAPANANSRNFTNEAERQYDAKTAAAEQNITQAQAAQDAAAQDLARQNAELETFRATQPQVSTALSDEFNAARKSARSEKNALYDAADPKTPADGRFLDEALKRIDEGMSNAERAAPGAYSTIAGRVRQVLNSGEAVTYGDVKSLKAQVSEARKNAIAASGNSVAGSGADVKRLDQLGQVLGHMADQINPEAAKHYQESFAPRFKQGRAGEYGAAVDRASRTGGESSATRPSDFAGKFLAKPEDAASLKRALTPAEEKNLANRIEGPSGAAAPVTPGLAPQTEQNIREWMLGDLAKSGVLNNNAEIRYDHFKRWADKNRETINQFPTLRDTVDKELAKAQRGGAISGQLSKDVAAAKANLETTKTDLRKSALQAAIGNSPENAVGSIMGSGDPEKRMAEMVGRLKGNQDATDGLKAATRDWIKQNEAGLTSKIVGDPDAVRLSRAKMERMFQRHEKTLAKLYTPEEMNALQQARKLMGAEAKLDVKATAGSNSVDKFYAAQNQSFEQKKRLLEAAFTLKYGVLVGGGIIRKMNMFLQTLPDGKRALDDILFEMQFNPDLAKHLLTRPIKEIDTKPWNTRLNKLLSAATAARDANEGPADKSDDGAKKGPMELTVTRKDAQR